MIPRLQQVSLCRHQGSNSEETIPVVLRDGSPVLHVSPSLRRSRWAPDLLTPNNILDVERCRIGLDPIANREAVCGTSVVAHLDKVRIPHGSQGENHITYTTTRSAHKVISQSTTMLTCTRASTVSDAEDLADFTGQRGHGPLRSVHSGGFACAHRWDARSWEAGSSTSASGETALEFGRAWT